MKDKDEEILKWKEDYIALENLKNSEIDKLKSKLKWHRQCEKNVIEAATKSEGKRTFFCLMLDGSKNILNTNYSECELTIGFEFNSSLYTMNDIEKWFEIPSQNAED